MKKKPCKVICNTRSGMISPAIEFPSIAEAVKWAKESGYFRYAVFVDRQMVRKGYCNP